MAHLKKETVAEYLNRGGVIVVIPKKQIEKTQTGEVAPKGKQIPLQAPGCLMVPRYAGG